MNIRKLVTWLAGATALALAACGGGGSSGGIGGTGGGGIGGTGVAYGTITAFGSVWVNGVEYSTSGTVFKTDDNPNGGGSQNDLRIGMVVQVDGSISGATASTITVDESIKGLVEAVPDSNHIVVMGQSIQIDATTIFDNGFTPAVNDRVNVYGLVVGDGIVAASFIEKKTTAPNPPFAVKGVVRNHNTTAQTFQVGSLTVQYSGTTVVSDMPAGTWNGLQVDVKGTACSAVAPACGTLTASQVEPAGAKLSSATDGEIEGIVSAVTASGFTIGNQVVATTGSTRYEGGVFGDIAVGTKLEAEGSISGGVLTATKVSFRDAARLEADVATIDAGTRTMTLSGLTGVTVNVPLFAELKGISGSNLGTLASGNHLRIRGRIGQGGVVVASQVELRGNDTRVELQAPASAVTPETSVTLLGITVSPISSAVYKDLNDAVISRTAFFSAAKVNSLIKARGALGGGSVTWDEMQLEN